MYRRTMIITVVNLGYSIYAPVRICVVIVCRMAVSTITIDSVIRGHHVYKAIWTP